MEDDRRVSLPIVTERLVLRPLRDEDLDALVAYRNDPEVARYQDWEEISRDDALSLVHAHDADRSLGAPGRWQQIAIDPGRRARRRPRALSRRRRPICRPRVHAGKATPGTRARARGPGGSHRGALRARGARASRSRDRYAQRPRDGAARAARLHGRLHGRRELQGWRVPGTYVCPAPACRRACGFRVRLGRERSGGAMRIKLASVMVDDQDKALAFYTGVLRFVKKTEIPMGRRPVADRRLARRGRPTSSCCSSR